MSFNTIQQIIFTDEAVLTEGQPKRDFGSNGSFCLNHDWGRAIDWRHRRYRQNAAISVYKVKQTFFNRKDTLDLCGNKEL